MGPWGPAATPGDDHSSRCDFVRTPGDPDNECYCETVEERAERRRYEDAVADGEPPEPYWVTL